MNSLRGNREQWAAVSASVVALAMALAVSLARRQQIRRGAPQSRMVVETDCLPRRPSQRQREEAREEEENVTNEDRNESSPMVVPGMGDAVGSSQPDFRGVGGHQRVICLLCNASMLYLGAAGHIRTAILLLLVTIFVELRGDRLTAARNLSLSEKDKFEFLQDLNPNTLNGLLREGLPRWVKTPDVERCEWLNKVIAQMWPCVKVVVARFMKEALVAELERVKHTTGMTAVGIHSLNFGTAPPKINGIKCFDETEHDQVALDVDLLVVTKNSEIVLSFGNPLLYATTNVEVSDIVLRGTLRAEFKPLFPWWPTLGAVAVSFIDRPTVDFQLKVLHINVMDLPSLSPILHKAVYSGVERCCLWPNKIVIPFVEDLTLLEVETLTENHSLGMLVLRDLRVSGVNPSRAYSRWSGVYGFCLRFSMGKESVATETIRGQTSFEFTGKAYKLLVLDPEIQDLAVTLECSEVLQTRKHINTQWVHLNNLEPRVGCSKQVSFGCDGDCRAEFELSWYPFTRQKHSPEAEVEPLPEDIARSGVVFIKLLRCEDLASMDISGTSDPYVVFHVGCQSKRSSVKRHTLNPIWDPPETFELLVSDCELDDLSVEVMDSDLLKTDDSIGSVQIALSPVQRATRVSDSWLLDGHCGSVALELQWRGLSRSHVGQ